MKYFFLFSPIKKLRITGIAEGFSFLVLLCIAMPLKYYAEMPDAVKITGWIHGVLFITYMVFLINVKYSVGWSYSKFIIAIVAALFP